MTSCGGVLLAPDFKPKFSVLFKVNTVELMKTVISSTLESW